PHITHSFPYATLFRSTVKNPAQNTGPHFHLVGPAGGPHFATGGHPIQSAEGHEQGPVLSKSHHLRRGHLIPAHHNVTDLADGSRDRKSTRLNSSHVKT